MSESEEKLPPEEAKRLADIAMQTSFNWVVMFLAFIAGLAGLLQIAKPYEARAFKSHSSIRQTVLMEGESSNLSGLSFLGCESMLSLGRFSNGFPLASAAVKRWLIRLIGCFPVDCGRSLFCVAANVRPSGSR